MNRRLRRRWKRHLFSSVAVHGCLPPVLSCTPAVHILSVLWRATQTVVIFGYPYTPKYVHDIPFVTFLFSLCPWALLSKAFQDLGNASAPGQPGISWSNRSRCDHFLGIAIDLLYSCPTSEVNEHRDVAFGSQGHTTCVGVAHIDELFD